MITWVDRVIARCFLLGNSIPACACTPHSPPFPASPTLYISQPLNNGVYFLKGNKLPMRGHYNDGIDKQAELWQIPAAFLSKKKTNQTATTDSLQECSDFWIDLWVVKYTNQAKIFTFHPLPFFFCRQILVTNWIEISLFLFQESWFNNPYENR